MNTIKSHRNVYLIIIVLLGVLVVGLLSRFVFFSTYFDKLDQGLQNIIEWQDNYKAEHPDATKEEMDAAFRAGIDNLEKWKIEYKAKNPGATDAEADAALDALFNPNK